MKNTAFTIILIFSTLCSFSQKEIKAGNSVELMFGNRKFITRNTGIRITGADFFSNIPVKTNSYQYLGIGVRKEIDDKNFVSILGTTHDDIIPINFEIAFGRFFTKNIGLEVGASVFNIPSKRGYPFDFENEFSEFKTLELIWSSDDMVYIKNITGFISPFYRFRYKLIMLNLSLKAGVGGLLKNSITYGGQSTKSFEVINVDYSAKLSPFPFVQPAFQIAFFPFHAQNSGLGFQLKGNFLPSKRQYNYDRRIDIWTDQNPVFESFSGSKHRINRSEIEFGLIWSK